MLHLDYRWDLYPDKIIIDDELNIDRLDWKHGDVFQLTNVNGKMILYKLDSLQAFAQGHNINRE